MSYKYENRYIKYDLTPLFRQNLISFMWNKISEKMRSNSGTKFVPFKLYVETENDPSKKDITVIYTQDISSDAPTQKFTDVPTQIEVEDRQRKRYEYCILK